MKRAEVFAQALAMPPRSRIELAAELLASAKGVPPGILEEDSADLDVVLARRIADLESGRVKSIPMKRVMKTLRTRAKARASQRRA
jgi:Putative addiction module component